MSASASMSRSPLPPHAQPDPLLLWTIDKLEQSLVVLRTSREEDVLLRTKIEEAIEIGYEVAYSRAAARSPAGKIFQFAPRAARASGS